MWSLSQFLSPLDEVAVLVFYKLEFFIAYTAFIDFSSVQSPYVEITGCPSPEHSVFVPFVFNLVEELVSFNVLCGLVVFAVTTFKDRVFMYLAVMAPDLLLVINSAVRCR